MSRIITHLKCVIIPVKTLQHDGTLSLRAGSCFRGQWERLYSLSPIVTNKCVRSNWHSNANQFQQLRMLLGCSGPYKSSSNMSGIGAKYMPKNATLWLAVRLQKNQMVRVPISYQWMMTVYLSVYIRLKRDFYSYITMHWLQVTVPLLAPDILLNH